MPQARLDQSCPFRPSPEAWGRLAGDVAPVAALQQAALERDEQLRFPDRVAHQYQIAGGRVVMHVASELPACLDGLGVFEPGSQRLGVGRISTGLGVPHAEVTPDFLGVMAAFQTPDRRRVDLIGINHPASPADNHHDFIDLLRAAGAATGAMFGGRIGTRTWPKFAAEQGAFGLELARRAGPVKACRSLVHLTRQTVRTSLSRSAYQNYWTGVFQARGQLGKFLLAPADNGRFKPARPPGTHRLSEEWRARQSAGDIRFDLYWLPLADGQRAALGRLTRPLAASGKYRVGDIVFPQQDPDSDLARLWALVASEMGANPGNWVADATGTDNGSATEFEAARHLAYALSQRGRGALEAQAYQSVFDGVLSEALVQELRRRAELKTTAGHVNGAPRAPPLH